MKNKFINSKFIVSGLLMASLTLTPIASALARDGHRDFHGDRRSHYDNSRNHDYDGAALGLGLLVGLVALTGAAIVNAADQPEPPQPVYVAPAYAPPVQTTYTYVYPQRTVVYHYAQRSYYRP